MKKNLLAVTTIFCLAFVAHVALARQGKAEIKFTTLIQHSQSAHEQKKNYAIRSQAEWQKLWQQMQPEAFLPKSTRVDSLMSKIDFNQQMIIAVFQGQKPSGGYGIVINKLQRDNKQIEVFIEEKSPGADCFTTQALTYPYHVIVTEKSAQKVVFTSRQSTSACR